MTLRLLFVLAAAISAGAADPAETKAEPEPAAFEFETESILCTIRPEGPYHGVSRLTEKRTGRQFIDERYSALNLFKLMSVNQMMDQPRRMERTFTTGPGRVEIKWAPTEGHAGTVTARYQVRPPDAIDLVVTVESNGSYPGYEVFLSSYFDKILRPHVHLKSRGKKPPERVSPEFNPVFEDTLLVFARDSHAARLCLDGRWDRNERKAPTVQLSPVRHYAQALAFATHPDGKTAVALMAKPEDVYAISARYFSEDEEKRQTHYTAFDYSLFGNDVNPGDSRSVRIRLQVIALENGDLSIPLKQYEAFLEENPKR